MHSCSKAERCSGPDIFKVRQENSSECRVGVPIWSIDGGKSSTTLLDNLRHRLLLINLNRYYRSSHISGYSFVTGMNS